MSVGGQDLRKVHATYTLHAPESMSVEQAKRTALTRAKIKAIEDEFGTVVSQSNVTRITNDNGQSDINFYSRGASDVRGEWVETIGQPAFDTRIESGMVIVSVSVEGRVRQLTEAQVELQAMPLRNGTELRFASTDFRDNDDLYLLFSSPADGYLSAWLVDNSADKAYRLLPYQRSKQALVTVEKNRNYIFFSPVKDHMEESGPVDEIIMSCGEDVEFNDLLIVYSPKRYALPKLTTADNLSSLPVDRFYSWLAKTRISRPDVVVWEETLTITKE